MREDEKAWLAQVQARVDAVPPPPWTYAHGDDLDHWELWNSETGEHLVQDDSGVEPSTEFLEFISHARSDIPRLLALVEEQEAKIAVLRAEVAEWKAAAEHPSRLDKWLQESEWAIKWAEGEKKLALATDALEEAKEGLMSAAETLGNCCEERCVPTHLEVASNKAYLDGARQALAQLRGEGEKG